MTSDAGPRTTRHAPASRPLPSEGGAAGPVDGADGAPRADEAVLASPLPQSRAGSRWLMLLLGVVVGGLLLGALAAALSTPLRRVPGVVATPLPAASGRAAGGLMAPPAEEAPAPPTGGGRGATGGAAGGQAGGAGRGGAASARSSAAGVIASVDGDTIVLNTPEGAVRVTLRPEASVQKLAPAERSELAAGQRVVVNGDRAEDGTVAASGIQIVGSGGRPASPGGLTQPAARQ